ncbi:MAG: hypothetical protein N2321_07305 [Melioribacteraceae bacterium]|nr:hypothetical protein [Melioribacteraceae bacterium]
MKKLLFILLLSFFSKSFAQEITENPNVDIFIIDSYITQEKPHKFFLSFSTSDSCKSTLKLNKLKNFIVSKENNDLHKIEIELNENDFIAEVITYQITLTMKNNSSFTSENYFVELPQDIIIKEVKNFDYTKMCIGGLVFAIPTFDYAFINGKEFLGLSKEIPLYNFYGNGYNYPQNYFSFEYSHYLKAETKNIIRFHLKHLILPSEIKYISAGLSYFSNLKGYNGIGFELSLGLFQIENVFTFFTKYRYNLQPIKNRKEFYEFSVGLYSNFFSLNF